MERGVTVLGIDNSPEMIELCRQKAHRLGLRPALFQQPMEDLLYVIDSDVFEGQSDILVPDFQAGHVAGIRHERALDACSGPGEPEQIAAQ